MKRIFLLLGMLTLGSVYSQTGKMGVNTTDPKATLDIEVRSANAVASATTNEGILIPRISRLRLGNTAAANLTESTLVYVNNISGATTPATVDVTSTGYYFYKTSLGKWTKITDNEDQDLRFVGTNNHITKDAGVGGNGTSAGTGIDNIAVGKNALSGITTGNSNIAMGTSSLGANTTGSNNIGVGNASGNWIKGNSNTHIGTAVGANSAELDNVVAIGNGIDVSNLTATTSQDNVILLGNDQANGAKVGIGTYKPTEKLTVNGNIAVGALVPRTGVYPQIGNYLSFEGTEDWNSMNGEFPNSDVFAFYRYDISQDNSHLRLNIGDNDGSIDAFSIGVRSGYQRSLPINNGYLERFRFEADGNAFKVGGYIWSVIADKNLKEDIKPYTKGLAQLKQISPIDFRYKADVGLGIKRHIGVAAQDLETVVPSMVGSTYDAKQGLYGVKYVEGNEYIFMLINAVKELSKRVEDLEADVAVLKSKVP